MRGVTADGEYFYLMFTIEELADMAPDVDEEELYDLGNALTKLWQDNMQQDINDLKF